jgi:hypothetical protein
MKTTLVAAILSLFVASAYASTTDSETIFFDGSNSNAVVQLQTEKTRTEYREETVPRTCYRTVIVGYRQVCRRPSNPRQPQQCWREPIYRNEAYTCYQTIRTPYEVFEYYVDAQIGINFGDVPEGIVAAENITASLNGDILTLRSQGSKLLVVELQDLTQNRRVDGNVLMIDASATIKFHDAQKIKAALNLTDVRIQSGTANYNLGPIAGLQLSHNLKIVNNPRLGGSTTLFDGEMNADVLSREERGNLTAMSVKFEDVLGRQLGSGRYNITVSSEFKAGRAVLNAPELGSLSAERTILYTLR